MRASPSLPGRSRSFATRQPASPSEVADMPLIKRYANRKLYDTEAKRYVTLEDLAGFVRQGEDVRVVDHATGEDLTSQTLFQIIFEEEKKIGGLLPQVFL